ncbi:MAG: MFS transporter [Kouleothrix sp.]|nr:MFS transporter [Kouleothrix sp.]
MRYSQLTLVFVCNLVPLFIGMGLFPLLPLYAAQFGATHTLVGLYYAAVYLASMAGVFLAGWLAARLSPRVVFVAASSLGIPALALLGLATALWQVVLLTATVWLCGSITLTLLSVFIGLISGDGRRGRAFSLMFLAYPLGAVLGGAAVGQLVAGRGYTTMFAALAAIWTIQPLAGLPLLRDRRFAGVATRAAAMGAQAPLGRSFALLLLSSLLGLAAISVGRLGSALSMQAVAFAPGAIASTATVSGLATIPAALLLGALSDRIGRGRSLLLCYLLGAGGVGVLLLATQLWHFWLATTLLFVAWSASRSVASAMAADVLPASALARGLPRLGAMDSLASIVGFASAGYAMDTLGATGLYVIALVLLGAAAQLLRAFRRGLVVAPRPAAPSAQAEAADGDAHDARNERRPVLHAGGD